jgi:hypothetical protein
MQTGSMWEMVSPKISSFFLSSIGGTTPNRGQIRKLSFSTTNYRFVNAQWNC